MGERVANKSQLSATCWQKVGLTTGGRAVMGAECTERAVSVQCTGGGAVGAVSLPHQLSMCARCVQAAPAKSLFGRIGDNEGFAMDS